MIHSRRRAHRRIFAVLAVGIPVLLASGLLLRPEVPPLPGDGASLFTAAGFERGETPAGVDVAAGARRFALHRSEEDARSVVLAPRDDLLRPDLLVYWTAQAVEDALPPDAVLVGSLAGTAPRRLTLPRAEGRLALYSLGHREVVSVLELP